MLTQNQSFSTILGLALTLSISASSVLVLSRAAPRLGLIDLPGGRKSHDAAVPLVGGLAIFVAVGTAGYVLGFSESAAWLFLDLAIILAAGLWDDVSEISPRLKFAIQICASAIMIWGADVELRSVGNLLGWKPIGLWIFAIPMTIFAIVGVVNSINMLDGVDGLAGSIGFVAFAWYGLMAAQSGLTAQCSTAVLFCGAIAGFLIFNLRLPWQKQARVFLGDAGSLMIGFALGWFAIDLTQGSHRTIPPIAALWVLILPLVDCVSVMIRRIVKGKSPFAADRHHIHHYLQQRGLTHGRSLAVLVALSVLFGAVGYVGWQLELPEMYLFCPFFFGFFVYHFWIEREWKRIEQAEAAVSSAAPRRDIVPAP